MDFSLSSVLFDDIIFILNELIVEIIFLSSSVILFLVNVNGYAMLHLNVGESDYKIGKSNPIIFCFKRRVTTITVVYKQIHM
jgi:hypothetical protein